MVVGDFAEELETVVIGSGPGGYVAAIRAAQLGQSVTLIERGNIGGVCLNVGCIPSKALIHAGEEYQSSLNASSTGIQNKETTIDFKKTQAWKNKKVVQPLTKGVEQLLKKNNVSIIKGEAYFVNSQTLHVMFDEEKGQTYKFEKAIIATGSRPIELKSFKFGERIIDSTGALSLTEIPKKMIVIGGGYIGTELAGAYAKLGTEVTILEGMDQILMGFEKDMVKLVEQNFKRKNVTVVTNAMAKSAEQNEQQVTVTYEADGAEKQLEADYVLVSVGRRPNTDDIGLDIAGIETDGKGFIQVDEQGRTNKKNIFAIGDIVPGLALAHKASYEAKVAAEAISGSKGAAVDYLAMPAVCFTDPELATVGFTEKEAKEKGFEVKTSKFPLAGNGRALSLNKAEGFIRLVTEKESQALLGAQVAGVNASDLIAELGLAVENGLTAEDIALTIHSHPSLGESIMDAAELALGQPIHI
ncbi:dihydrolipoyl dehydrogenase [Carnobacterium antarcticum]|uniref:Dihydrolipoyl dehydrogenase n=1 Tax=Carnobacterium antarcticum TaxID=2126436 RepID=A0ABW4NLR0_9LACT|nr:dihydrolipoyl dehydrogenase [Carnobacterium sp. CP1]ALV22080.1 Dihydrolipoamide dehydrogenase of pyruvate dehydrogenase complex [Carnobacterium sp. CP1]